MRKDEGAKREGKAEAGKGNARIVQEGILPRENESLADLVAREVEVQDGNNKVEENMKPLIIILIPFAFLNIDSCKNNPVDSKPENRSPVLSSVVMFPQVVGPSDSLIVICDATDPDNDTLVYDWFSLSGSIVKIKGAHDGDMARYNTYQNSQIFYAPESRFVKAPRDTFGLQCGVRDRKGEGDVSNILLFIVIKDS